jgi:hypothetical protein
MLDHVVKGTTANVGLGATPREGPNGLLTTMNCNTTTSCCKHLRVKEVGKQSNAINLHYLNFLGTVMLRPLLVIWGSGAWDDSSPTTPLPHASFWVQVSWRLFCCLFGTVVQSLKCLQSVFPALSVFSFGPVLEPYFPSPSPSPPPFSTFLSQHASHLEAFC